MSVIFDTLHALYSGTCVLWTPTCNNIGVAYAFTLQDIVIGASQYLLSAVTNIQLTALLEDIDGLLKIEMFAV